MSCVINNRKQYSKRNDKRKCRIGREHSHSLSLSLSLLSLSSLAIGVRLVLARSSSAFYGSATRPTRIAVFVFSFSLLGFVSAACLSAPAPTVMQSVSLSAKRHGEARRRRLLEQEPRNLLSGEAVQLQLCAI
ncbi:hypothetical protein TIFTF001_019573 [Ficus carica]|uniref:Transmembrane protein n=1 Tax=Ficus carica TaxID=3494 RepID=A0AA88AGM6_FICCA|nr:hypothetical protein TIFTF001_019573 [Ficus carica]